MVEGLLRALAELVRAGNARHADMLGLDVPGRLAKWLLTRAEAHGDQARGGTRIALNRSQGELAAELGTTRSTLNRTLQGFEALSLLTVGSDHVILLKPDRLRAYTT